MSRILIVEDNEKNLKLFRLIVASMGHATLSAPDGEEGVRSARENLPDLVLMDIQMPKMDGISALRLLKADERTQGIPVIAVTSFAMRGDRERLLAEGFVDHITKPVEKDRFIQNIEKVLLSMERGGV